MVLASASLISCKKDDPCNEAARYALDCDMESARPVMLLSDVVDGYSILPLQSDDLMGVIDRLYVDDSGIYVVSEEEVWAFDTEGRERFRISAKGRSVSEYLELRDCCLSDRFITVSDTEGKKILLYNKTDGKHFKTLNLDFYADKICYLNDTVLAINCSGSKGPRLVTLNTVSGRILGSSIDYDDIFTEPVAQPFIRFGESLLYKMPFYNDLFEVSDDGIKGKLLTFDFKDYNFNIKGVKRINFGFFSLLVDTWGNAHVNHVYNVKSKFVTQFICQSRSEESNYMMITDTLTHSKQLIDSESFTDDVTFYDFVIYPQIFDCCDDRLVCVIYPDYWTDTFPGLTDERKSSPYYQSAFEQYRNLSGNDNPLLVFYHLK